MININKEHELKPWHSTKIQPAAVAFCWTTRKAQPAKAGLLSIIQESEGEESPAIEGLVHRLQPAAALQQGQQRACGLDTSIPRLLEALPSAAVGQQRQRIFPLRI
jgi:hypothetical protein